MPTPSTNICFHINHIIINIYYFNVSPLLVRLPYLIPKVHILYPLCYMGCQSHTAILYWFTINLFTTWRVLVFSHSLPKHGCNITFYNFIPNISRFARPSSLELTAKSAPYHMLYFLFPPPVVGVPTPSTYICFRNNPYLYKHIYPYLHLHSYLILFHTIEYPRRLLHILKHSIMFNYALTVYYNK